MEIYCAPKIVLIWPIFIVHLSLLVNRSLVNSCNIEKWNELHIPCSKVSDLGGRFWDTKNLVTLATALFQILLLKLCIKIIWSYMTLFLHYHYRYPFFHTMCQKNYIAWNILTHIKFIDLASNDHEYLILVLHINFCCIPRPIRSK